jgi:hypothetical protein
MPIKNGGKKITQGLGNRVEISSLYKKLNKLPCK